MDVAAAEALVEGLRLVGAGPELSATRQLADRLGEREQIEFLDSIESWEQLRVEYERASVFCLPTLQEGFGIVFVEAMSHGVPIVAVRAGAVPEVAPDGVTSILVEPGDAPAVAKAILRVLTNPSLAAELGTCGLQRAATYTWRASALAFLAGLQD